MPIGRKKKSPNLGSQSLTAGSYRPNGMRLCFYVILCDYVFPPSFPPFRHSAVTRIPKSKRCPLRKNGWAATERRGSDECLAQILCRTFARAPRTPYTSREYRTRTRALGHTSVCGVHEPLEPLALSSFVG